MQLDFEPKRLSPIHDRHQVLDARFAHQADWLVPEVYTTAAEEIAALRESVGLTDISPRGKLTLKGSKADGIIIASFGTIPTNRGDAIAVKSSHLLVARLTSDEFWIFTPPGAEKETAASLEAAIVSQGTFITLIDQTSGLVGFSIRGPNSVEVLVKLCALPFDPKDFPDMHLAQSSFAKVRATIVRNDQDDLLAFEIYADRSYADYLWDTILDAGKEFGIQPVGWEATENP